MAMAIAWLSMGDERPPLRSMVRGLAAGGLIAMAGVLPALALVLCWTVARRHAVLRYSILQSALVLACAAPAIAWWGERGGLALGAAAASAKTRSNMAFWSCR